MNYFQSINFTDFRVLKNKDLNLGKYVTMLAGWNATGKSTVLALLAHSTESKEKSYYSGRMFRAPFEEILQGDKQFDEAQSDRVTISCSLDTKKFRTAWQQDRFRVIPKDIKTGAESKFSFPVIYLGLSRLFPIGELPDTDQSISVKDEFYCDSEKEWFQKTYDAIMSKKEVIKEISRIDVKAAKKEKWGISTASYGWKANSAGQDNVSQILYALLSFRALQMQQGDQYEGGIFLIDELDAALHPKAQQKILDVLIKEAKTLNIQIVFTTHSLTLIKYFYTKKENDRNSNLISYYFTYENDVLNINADYNYEQIKQDTLLPILSIDNRCVKVVVYTEDDEARWLLKKLLSGVTPAIDIRKVAIGCASLVDLMNCEPCFHNYIVVFDGDFNQSNKKRIKKHRNNMLVLPTRDNKLFSPEEELHRFIFSNASEDYLTNAAQCTNGSAKLEYFREHDVSTCRGQKMRDQYKNWFKVHKKTFEQTKLYTYWAKANESSVRDFQQRFIQIYNTIAQRINASFKLEYTKNKLKKIPLNTGHIQLIDD